MDNEITINGVTYIRKDKCNCPFMNDYRKYGFTGLTKIFNRHILHQIIALKDFGDVKRGDIGGWIESDDNLTQAGNAWVSGNAWVYGNARVYGNAMVFGRAMVYGNAMVYGDAMVCENALVCDNVKVH